jgi:hypothetical protein
LVAVFSTDQEERAAQQHGSEGNARDEFGFFYGIDFR